jgi:hypothetical protein
MRTGARHTLIAQRETAFEPRRPLDRLGPLINCNGQIVPVLACSYIKFEQCQRPLRELTRQASGSGDPLFLRIAATEFELRFEETAARACVEKTSARQERERLCPERERRPRTLIATHWVENKYDLGELWPRFLS